MTFTPVLYCNQGSVEALPVILLADYLGTSIEIKSLCQLPNGCTCQEGQTCLQVSETDCIKTATSQMRYLARLASSELYNESGE